MPRCNNCSSATAAALLIQLQASVEALPQDPPRAFSTSRRLAVSAIMDLLGRQPALQQDAGVTAALERLALGFLRLYLRSMAAAASLGFHHMSKTGGTSLCAVAKRCGCLTSNSSKLEFAVCQEEVLGDNAIWFQEVFHSSVRRNRKWASVLHPEKALVYRQEQECEKRADVVRRLGLQYVSNERHLPGGQLNAETAAACPQFHNIALLRQPARRLASQVRHMFTWEKLQIKVPRELQGMLRLAPYALDNRYSRCLLGEQQFFQPVGSLLRGHAELAAAKLHGCDLIMVVDDVASVDLGLNRGLGWSEGMGRLNRNPSSRHFKNFNDEDWGVGLSPEVQSALLQLNAVDMHVWAYATWLAAADAAWLASLGQSQPQGAPAMALDLVLRSGLAHQLRPEFQASPGAADTAAGNARCGYLGLLQKA